MQNMAARLVSGVRRCDHITPVLEDLHWLPVPRRMVFKTALLVWKCVCSIAPAYLRDLCIPATATSGQQQLLSATTGALLVPCARTAMGQRSFAVNGPTTWNSLPPALYGHQICHRTPSKEQSEGSIVRRFYNPKPNLILTLTTLTLT